MTSMREVLPRAIESHSIACGCPNRRGVIAALEQKIPDGVHGELKRLYYDTADSAFPQNFAALLSYVPASQVLFGSDSPYVSIAENVKDFGARLANAAIGHGAADGGIGYTYFDQKTGYEFSAVTGLTYNLVNPSTGYQNGIDWHLDWGASKFLTKRFQIGAVGYVYNQITADRGCLQVLCPFESRTVGVGPQLGVLFPNPSFTTYLNLKAYWDFDTQNRASGASAWITLAFSPNPPAAEKAPPPTVTK